MTAPMRARVSDGTGDLYRDVRLDLSTHSLQTIEYSHHEIHGGSAYFVEYSVASLGAMTTPDDMITLTFTTPDTTKWFHFTFEAKGTAGWRVRFIEAPSGGAASQTEQLEVFNMNRNSSNTSGAIALDGTAGEVSYDATLATGGKTLVDEYLEGAGGPLAGGTGSGGRQEFILKQNTKYQLSLYGTDADPGTLKMAWYEHTNKT